jgi:hypothetical protein
MRLRQEEKGKMGQATVVKMKVAYSDALVVERPVFTTKKHKVTIYL